MHVIAAWIESKNHTPKQWDDTGFFPAGGFTFNRLIEITKLVQAAVFVFGEDDEQWYREDTVQVTRDNVLIEYGLFTGALGLKRAIICRNGEPKQPSDLLGITYINVSENKRANAKAELEKWLDELQATRQPTEGVIEAAQIPRNLFDKRDKLGNEEVLILKIIIKYGKHNDYAMTYAEIEKEYIKISNNKSINVDIPLVKLINRSFIQMEPGKIRACSITTTGWEWIAMSNEFTQSK